jgi:hypothetical protein
VPRALPKAAALAHPAPARRTGQQKAAAPRTPSKPPMSRPAARSDRREPPPPKKKHVLAVAAGAGAALLVLLVLATLYLREGAAPVGKFRVPSKGWTSPGPAAPALKQIHSSGGYGNCVFSSRQIERDKETQGAVRSSFSAGEPIYGRCYFARPIGPNKSGEVWQELWIDGVKRAQVIYDPSLPDDEDQIALDISRRHGSRITELSSGKHTLDIWIYRQPEDAETPEPLAAGELVVRK